MITDPHDSAIVHEVEEAEATFAMAPRHSAAIRFASSARETIVTPSTARS